MNPILESFLRGLAEFPDASVLGIHRKHAVVTANVSFAGITASLVCNEAAPPAGHDRRGRKFYGAYVIADEGYGDWVKGDNAEECVAYAISWLHGRGLRRAVAARSTQLDLLGQSGKAFAPSELGHIVRELSERSSLRLFEPDHLVSADGRLSVRLEVAEGGGVLAEVTARDPVHVVAATEPMLAAAILGFVDGVSDGADE